MDTRQGLGRAQLLFAFTIFVSSPQHFLFLFQYPVPKFVLVPSVPQNLLWMGQRASVRANFVT